MAEVDDRDVQAVGPGGRPPRVPVQHRFRGLPRPAPTRLRSLVPWLPPVIAVLLVLLLTGLDLNGSSVQLLNPRPRDDRSLVWGHPRGVRSDEYQLSTPEVIGNARRGMPVQPWIGLTRTFLPATSLGVPVKHWTLLFQPREWAFFVLPPDRGFAWWWWWPLLIGFCGVYALLFLIGRSTLVATGLAVTLVASPYTGWWSEAPALIGGCLAAAAACAVAGLQARRWRSAVGYGVLGGWFAVGGVLALYPPWQVSVAWVLAAAVAGLALDRRVGWRRLGLVAGCAFAVVVPAVLVWARQSGPALRATSATLYPGNRISTAGQASLARLLDAASSLWTSTGYWVRHALAESSGPRADNGVTQLTNASELSATWLPLPLLLVAVIAVVWAARRRARGRDHATPDGGLPASAVLPSAADDGSTDGRIATDAPTTSQGGTGEPNPTLLWTTVLVAAAELLVLAWALLPLPQIVGTVTLLDRVPGYRTPLALGLGAVLIMAGGSATVRGRRLPGWLIALVGAGWIATVAALVWSSKNLPWDHARPQVFQVAGIAAVVGGAFALLLLGRRAAAVGASVLAVATFAVFDQIDPLTHGVGPLQDDPVIAALQPFVGHGGTRAAVYGDPKLSALVSSTGLENLSGLTPYPDADLWRSLDPGQESAWNNYAKYVWKPFPYLDRPVIETDVGTQSILLIDPCAPSTRALGITVSVSATRLTGSCLTLRRTVRRTNGTVYIYISKA